MGKSKNLADLGSHDVIDTHSTGMTVTGTVTADSLGIGTSSPQGNGVHIVPSGGDTALFLSSSTGDTNSDEVNLVSVNKVNTGFQPLNLKAYTTRFYASTSEAMRIDSSGNLLVGKTASDFNTQGFEINSGGQLRNSRASGAVAFLNRKTDDGSIVELGKDGSVVGSIGVNAGDNLYIGSTSSGHSGLGFGSNELTPMSPAGTNSDGGVNLGYPTRRFNSLYLSGSTQSKNDYSYSVLVSNTTNPTLKNADGSTWGNSEAGIVMLYISGTGTPDTDQVFMLGSNGSSTHQVRGISTNSPNVSNRPNLSINSSGDPILTTGHSSTYTVHVRVLKVP